MADVCFSEGADVVAQSPCRICAARQSVHVLSVTLDETKLQLFRCEQCESLFYDGANPAKTYEVLSLDNAFWLDYVQAGAGITNMLAPLFAIEPSPSGRLLDVGCGFGFVVDFWRAKNGDAAGLEPSKYGAVGRQKLGVDIRPQSLREFLADNPAFKADVVFSSEVIEHAPEPGAFAEELTKVVEDNGIIVVTTPSPAVIQPSTDPATIIAALSPGFHYCLISPKALKQFFTSRGFHTQTVTHGNQKICWAGRGPLPTINTARFLWTEYFDYLERLATNGDPHVATGAVARLFKDTLNTGFADRAARAFDRLCSAARQYYAIDLERPEIGPLLALQEPLSGLERFPSWLGGALLFGGLHVGHSRNDRRTKLRMLDAALAVLTRRATVDRQFGQEAAHLLPFAERQYMIALSEALTVGIIGASGPPPADLRATLNSLIPVTARFLQTM